MRKLRRAAPSEVGISNGKCIRQEKPEKKVLSLVEFETGIRGEVSHLDMSDTRILRKLIAMNLLPGENSICKAARHLS